MLIGLRPLVYGCGLKDVPIMLERINNYEVVRSCFHRGEPRTFSRVELRHLFGGFVAEHASVDEYESAAQFAAELEQTRFTDYYWVTRRMRYRRPQSTRRAALDMEVSWSSGSQSPRYATINGRPMPEPILKMDGVLPEEIPFLNEPFEAIPPFFPWKDFENVWYDLPYAIGDRED
jgi:hypothetical protein